ncbi:MAG TPA: carbon-nitrogen hydrolase family protein [Polyangiaceae bacterium]|jgi:predicted amidohydrolase|nr:carbon-nitrogen hydrolase family protein [Polyangiaceae bacterium]
MTSRQTYRAAVVQTLAVLGDLDTNIRLLREYTGEAVRQGASLVVFPECMNTGYLFDSVEHCRALAEPVDGRFAQAMSELARRHGIHIASGFTELDRDENKVFNSGLLFDARGELVLQYQKQFLATHDQNWFEVGERGCPVVETELGRLGLLICFDGRIPEIARCLALSGADVIVDMANFFAMDQAEMWVPARAYENGVWFVAATKAGVERSIYYPGGSMIVAPDGDVRARVPYDVHGVVSAEIVLGDARRKDWPSGGQRFADRRPGAYAALSRRFDETDAGRRLATPLVPERSLGKLAAVQAHATSGAPDHGLAALEMASHAGKLGVDIVVLPQFVSSATWSPAGVDAEADARHAPECIRRASEIAREYQCVVVLPLLERQGSELSSNAVVLGADGAVLGRQRQVHVEPEMRAFCAAGNEFTVFDTPYGRLGVLLGYDGMFPESARALALAGADVIAWPCTLRHPRDRALLAVPKAEDNRVYVVCANRTDAPYPGGSFVIPPSGFPHWEVDREAPPVRRHGAVMPMHANLALSRQKYMIPKVDMLRNRITSTYGPIVATPTR